MAESQEKKILEKQLIAQVSVELTEKFKSQLDQRKQTQKYAIASAIRLWTELPVDLQAHLLDESLDADSFIEIVRAIVDERMKTGASPASAGGRPPTETLVSQSIDNIKYYVTYKLLSPEMRKELEGLRKLLGAEEKSAGRKSKRA